MQDKKLKQNWCNFIELFLEVSNVEDISALFDLMLTNAEQEDVATRYAIVKELLEGKRTQREIARHLNVSVAKVTRGSNALRIAGPRIKKLITP